MYLYRLLQLSTTFQGYVIITKAVRSLCEIFPKYENLIGLTVVVTSAILIGLYFHFSRNYKLNYFLFVMVVIGSLVGGVI